MKRRIATILIASSLLLVPGFGQEKNRRPASPQAQARISKEVRHQILMLPYFDVFDNIA
jgi:hypothetical protein